MRVCRGEQSERACACVGSIKGSVCMCMCRGEQSERVLACVCRDEQTCPTGLETQSVHSTLDLLVSKKNV